MNSGFDTSLPSVRQIQTIIKDQKSVEIKLLTGEVLAGKVRWQDQSCLCLSDDGDRQTFVWRQAIAYIKPTS